MLKKGYQTQDFGDNNQKPDNNLLGRDRVYSHP